MTGSPARGLNATVSLDSKSAYAAAGAAPNGADDVLLRSDGEALPGQELSALRFTGQKTAGTRRDGGVGLLPTLPGVNGSVGGAPSIADLRFALARPEHA